VLREQHQPQSGHFIHRRHCSSPPRNTPHHLSPPATCSDLLQPSSCVDPSSLADTLRSATATTAPSLLHASFRLSLHIEPLCCCSTIVVLSARFPSAMADKESDLLNKVLMRLALTDNDKMAAAIAQFLVPVLTKLHSPHASTIAKANEVLAHITERLSALRTTTVPLAALLDLYASPDCNDAIRNSAMDFIVIGASRIARTVCSLGSVS
jgi:hypothetical protein